MLRRVPEIRPESTLRSDPGRVGAFENKVGAAFTTASTPHDEHEMIPMSLAVSMTHLGMVLASQGYAAEIYEDVASPYGATARSRIGGARVANQRRS